MTVEGVENSYLTMQDLRDRGWNQRLVALFLGSPDDLQRPAHRAGRPMRLYLSHRVDEVESNCSNFKAEKQRSENIGTRTRASIQTKSDNLFAFVTEAALPEFTASYEDVLTKSENKSIGCAISSKEQLALQFLLGTMDSLGDDLNLYSWHSGIREARVMLKNRLLGHIAVSYPQLAEVAKLNRASLAEGRKLVAK